MTIAITLFTTGILGFIMNRRHLILILISIELILLSITVIILYSSYNYDCIMGQIYSIFIIAIAGAESALGLGIIICYYNLRGNVNIYVNTNNIIE